jgi:hypothetical protein
MECSASRGSDKIFAFDVVVVAVVEVGTNVDSWVMASDEEWVDFDCNWGSRV